MAEKREQSQVDPSSRVRAESRLSQISECFLKLGAWPLENINHLTALFGEQLGAKCAYYCRLYDGNIAAWARWNSTHDCSACSPESSICMDVIMAGGDQVSVIGDLQESHYAASEATFCGGNFKTYAGRATNLHGQPVGVLCALFDKDYVPTEGDKNFISIVASAIEVEEKRKVGDEALRESEAHYRAVVEDQTELILRFDTDGTVSFANEVAREYLGLGDRSPLGLSFMSFLPEEDRDELARHIASLTLSRKEPVAACESRLVGRSGRTFWVRWTFRAIFDEQEHLREYQAVGRDVTENKKAENRLHLLSSACEQTVEGMLVTDLNGKLLFVNGSCAAAHGYSPKELTGKHFRVLHTPEQMKHVEMANKQLIETGKFSGEIWHVRSDGTEFPTMMDYSLLRNDKGETTAFIGTLRDISERKRAEEAQQLSHSFLEVANRNTEMTPLLDELVCYVEGFMGCDAIGIRILDKDGNIPYHAYTGFTEEFHSLENNLCIHKHRCLCINVIQGEVDPKLPHFTGQGSFYSNDVERYVAENKKRKYRGACHRAGFSSLALIPFGADQNIYGLLQIADPEKNMVPIEKVKVLERAAEHLAIAIQRVAAKEELRRSGEALAEALDREKIDSKRLADILEAIWITNAEKSVDDICRCAVECVRDRLDFDRAGLWLLQDGGKTFIGTFGTDTDGNTVDEHGHTIPAQSILESWEFISGRKRYCILDSQKQFNLEWATKYQKEMMKDIECVGRVALRSPDRVLGFISVNNGKTQRPITEQDMAYLALFAENVANAIVAAEEIASRTRAEEALRESEEKYRNVVENAKQGIIVIQNGKAVFFNAVTYRILGYTGEELEKRQFIDSIHPDDQQMVLSNLGMRLGGQDVPKSYDLRVLKKGGEALWCTINPVIINWNGEPATMVFLTDATEKRRTEKAMEMASRMEVTETLAGGIAHKFNNLMTTILGNTGYMLAVAGEDDPNQAFLKEIENTAAEAGDLAHQMLAFARGGKYKPALLDPNRVIEDMLLYQELNVPGGVNVDKLLDDSVYGIEADATQLSLALLALLTNAFEAIEDEGTVSICTLTEDVDKEESSGSPGLKAGTYVVISIQDTGCGMEPEVAERVFEPFYTTKFLGRGLGLSAVYGIVKNHGGYIQLDTKPDEGTIFKLYFPAVELHESEDQSVESEVLTGTETILIVDDEEMVLKSTGMLLRHYGYKVHLANDPKDALEQLRDMGESVDLVLLDMVMPSMNAEEALPLIKDIRKELKVILITGYDLDDSAQKLLENGADEFLRKPVSGEKLTRTIRRVLRQR